MLTKNKIVILGKSASGKDYLAKKLSDIGNLKICLKTTTRPIRIGEKNGHTYNYKSYNEFINMINCDEFLTFEKFTVTPKDKKEEIWYYGISNSEFEKSDIFILTPSELNNIKSKIEFNPFIIYLDISKEIRINRLSQRNDKNDSINRRIEADEIDFLNLNGYHLRIKNPNFDPVKVLNKIKGEIKAQ